MALEVLGQPYRDRPTGESFVTQALTDPRVTRVLILTAWVRESGIGALVPGLHALRARGGAAEMFVGIDLKGTTRQGLELARKHAGRLYVVHDPAGRTFHPKLYLAVGAEVGYALIGSHNLTAGGLAFNYEGSLAYTFDPRRDTAIADGIEAYAEAIRNDRGICRRVTAPVAARLVTEGWLADESTDRAHRDEDRPRRPPRPAPGSDPLFTAGSVGRRSRTLPRGQGPGAAGASTATRTRMALAPDCWWKRLGAGEAQRLPAGNVTGVVRLTPPRNVADRARFFDRVFFADEAWRPARDRGDNPIRVADVLFDVELGERSLGALELELVYAAHRQVRSRATTNLHLGPLAAELRRVDARGWYLLIERGVGAYRLVITPRRPL